MNDEFMLGALRKPRADFAKSLRKRLDEIDGAPVQRRHMRPTSRYLAYAATVLIAVGLFAFPSVRAGARAFLDMFRVVNFAPVRIQTDRLLASRDLDLPHLIGDQVEVLKEPTPAVQVDNAAAAGAAAGIRVREPAWRPAGLSAERFDVSGGPEVRVTVSAEKLQGILDSFGLDDLSVPAGIDGKAATVRVFPMVSIQYGDAKRHRVTLTQARQPEVGFPAGTDLAALAEIALRILGIERSEAYRFAHSVDWRTTLIVPIPPNVSAFRQVDIQGKPGLIVETGGEGPGSGPRRNMVMWSSGESVFVMTGNVMPSELFEMAQSVQ